MTSIRTHAAMITADHKGYPQFGDGPSEAHDDGCHNGKSGFFDDNNRCLKTTGAEGTSRVWYCFIDSAESRNSETKQKWRDQEHLSYNHDCRREQKVESTQRASPGKKDQNKEPNDNGGYAKECLDDVD